MKTIVEEFDVRGPLINRELREATNIARERAICDKTEYTRSLQRIIELLALNVRLPNEVDFGVTTAVLAPLHGGKRYWLMPRNQFALPVTCWKCNE